jgi:signal transduction histidine kinase
MALNDKTALFESLAGGIAHELNNALSPVLGYAELLDMRLGSSGDHAVLKSYCGAIIKSRHSRAQEALQLGATVGPVPGAGEPCRGGRHRRVDY